VNPEERRVYNRVQKRRRRSVDNPVRADTDADRIADIARTFADNIAQEIVRFLHDLSAVLGGALSPAPLKGALGEREEPPVRADADTADTADTDVRADNNHREVVHQRIEEILRDMPKSIR
jgi:hypothetical protein